MIKNKRILLVTFLLTIFLINIIATASAYSNLGYKWASKNPTIQKDSTIPSSWSTALTASTNTWNNAGANFAFSWGQTVVNKLKYGTVTPSTYLAMTFPDFSNGYFNSCYTKFNSQFTWSTSASGESGKADVQGVATHELGHWLALGDLYGSGDSEKTMYYATALGETKKRSLESDDIAGIKAIYGTKSKLVSSDYLIDDNKQVNSNDKSINNEDLQNVKMSATVIKCTHDDLKKNSDMIVKGTVKEILPSKWNTINGEKPNKTNIISDQDCFIYTDIIVNVDKYLKNPLSSKEVIVRTYGGKVGNDKMILGTEPYLEPGEKVLLYLSKDTSSISNDGSEHFFVYGALQGKFTLTDDGKAVRPDETVNQDKLLSTI